MNFHFGNLPLARIMNTAAMLGKSTPQWTKATKRKSLKKHRIERQHKRHLAKARNPRKRR